MSSYTITAVRDLPRWTSTPTQAQLDEYNRTQQAYHDDIAKMLAEAFPPPHEVTGRNDKGLFHHLPTIKLVGDDPRGLWDVVSLKVTNNGFLRLSLTIAYREKIWKQVKMTLSRDSKTYTIDGEKLKDAATALIAAYHIHYTRVAQIQSAEEVRNAAEVEAFKVLRPKVESQGISFATVRDDGRGGVILLTGEQYGPRIEVMGKTCVLKLATHANSSVTIYPDLIPAFADLFAQNDKALAPATP